MRASRSFASARRCTLNSGLSPFTITGLIGPISRMSGLSLAIGKISCPPARPPPRRYRAGGRAVSIGSITLSVGAPESVDERYTLDIRCEYKGSNRQCGGRLPMSYVKSVLKPGEEIRFATDIHWMVYIPGFLLLLVAIAVYVVGSPLAGPDAAVVMRVLAGLLFAAAAVWLFIGWFRRWTTEVAVTNKRIIYKRGFISRYTIEMHLEEGESVEVDQTILGRILGYGDIITGGVGASLEPLRNI